MNDYLRPELPELPRNIAQLPRHRGYPVPWFVAWFQGKPDFRVVKPDAVQRAVDRGLCWVCGKLLVGTRAYVVGPMCAVNRASAEPPSHRACATFSARACPFLTKPHARRREAGLPTETVEAPGIMLRRNPGLALVWVTRDTRIMHLTPTGPLFDIGIPIRVEWWAEGREATRDEVMASIESGLPLLRGVAEEDGPAAVEELEALTARAMKLVPA